MFALKLTLRRKDGFHELIFGRIPELVIQAFDINAAFSKRGAQLKMKLPIPGKAFQIIEDNSVGFIRLGIDIGEQSHHAWAF
ncbi:MAG: hypothetical protein AAFQ29_11085 [Pseudomonadota bacterium]